MKFLEKTLDSESVFDFSLYTYSFDFNGINFNQHSGYNLINKWF